MERSGVSLALILVAGPAGPIGAADPDLYDPSILRTIALEFPTDGFFSQIDTVSRTTADGYVTADLTFEGVTYPGVGVRFRGNTSQRNAGQKRSFKIAIDHTNEAQRVWGYRTLKLNNAAADPSFLREVLYSRIASRYYPCPTANFVKLVLNGESWGIYVNVQQFNKDFLEAWFERTGGDRWKSPSGGGTGPGGAGGPGGGFVSGDRALKWLGSTVSTYRSFYELKTDDTDEAWSELLGFCDDFNNVEPADIDAAFRDVLDVDGALWMIALENVFTDEDGYLYKGADYAFYTSRGRLYLVQHDGNETFRDPQRFHVLDSENNANRPIVLRLLSIPHLRERYLAHVRTVMDDWLSWEKLEPMARPLHDLIASEVAADTKKIYSTEFFETNFESSVTIGSGPGGRTIPGLRQYVTERRQYLLSLPELQATPPAIRSVELSLPRADAGWEEALPGEAVTIMAQIESASPVTAVLAHHGSGVESPFATVALLDDGLHGDDGPGDGLFGGEIPGYPGGTDVLFHVEARGSEASAFEPARAERGALGYHVGVTEAPSTPVVINELVASNSASLADPQGEFDDWVELRNVSSGAVDLSGMFLSDDAENPRKWQFHDGTSLAAGGFLIVFLDEDGDGGGLHANFKLSSEGEEILLTDADARLNGVLDHVVFGALETDTAWGRFPDGGPDFALLAPTPGTRNAIAPRPFRRGDSTDDGIIDLADAVQVLIHLFGQGASPACASAGDADDSGAIDLTDPIYLLNYLFLGGPIVPQPFETCGLDPTVDALGCVATAACPGA